MNVLGVIVQSDRVLLYFKCILTNQVSLHTVEQHWMHSRTNSGYSSISVDFGIGSTTNVERHLASRAPCRFQLSNVLNCSEVDDLYIGNSYIAAQRALLTEIAKRANHNSLRPVLQIGSSP